MTTDYAYNWLLDLSGRERERERERERARAAGGGCDPEAFTNNPCKVEVPRIGTYVHGYTAACYVKPGLRLNDCDATTTQRARLAGNKVTVRAAVPERLAMRARVHHGACRIRVIERLAARGYAPLGRAPRHGRCAGRRGIGLDIALHRLGVAFHRLGVRPERVAAAPPTSSIQPAGPRKSTGRTRQRGGRPEPPLPCNLLSQMYAWSLHGFAPPPPSPSSACETWASTCVSTCVFAPPWP